MASPVSIPGGLRLDLLVDSDRCRTLDRLDAYMAARQYNDLKYDWDGRLSTFDGTQWYTPVDLPPLRARRPDLRFDLPKLITRSLTAMVLGEERWPDITFPGDSDAEDYAKATAQVSKFQTKMNEVRNRGGAAGTACVSFGFVEGKPRLYVHRARHVTVLRWADRDDHVIGAALKAYRYEKTEYERGQPKKKAYYFARYWDENTEIVWDPIPEERAKDGTWPIAVTSYAVDHQYGAAPIYWTQNIADSECEDGHSDFDGLSSLFDSINRLLSQTLKGTIANVDPTLVIHDDPIANQGSLRKGSESAIYSKLGAEYLTLPAEAVKAALDLTDKLVRYALDTSGVVIGDPNEIAAKVTSAAALKIIYLPMLNTCSLLRTQYGELIENVTLGMLRAARKLRATPGEILITADGYRLQKQPTVVLPPRVEVTKDAAGAATITSTERKPGTSEEVLTTWPPYFQPTAADLQATVDGLNKAKGSIISDKTAVRVAQEIFPVDDVDAELEQIEIDNHSRAILQSKLDQGSLAGAGGNNAGAED